MTNEHADMDKGIAVFPEGGSNYGLLIKWEPPSEYFKGGSISMVEIVKARTESGYKLKMSTLNDAQKTRGTYSKRIYLWRDVIHGVLEAINRVMAEGMGETGPDVESIYQYEKKGKANRSVDEAVGDMSEFSGGGSDVGDETAPF